MQISMQFLQIVEPDGLEMSAPTFSACCPQKEQRVFE
jgi:hypothetical protein